MSDHEQCREGVRADMAQIGIDVAVSTAPPIIVGPMDVQGYTCPHGTTYWYWREPTGEQVAQWRRDGVR